MITNKNNKNFKTHLRLLQDHLSKMVFQGQEKQKHQTNFDKICLYGEDP